jgi:hypothetical protein
MKCPADTKCSDNCGKIIKKGEDCIGVKEYYDGKWHKVYRCVDCQWSRDDEQRSEDTEEH